MPEPQQEHKVQRDLRLNAAKPRPARYQKEDENPQRLINPAFPPKHTAAVVVVPVRGGAGALQDQGQQQKQQHHRTNQHQARKKGARDETLATMRNRNAYGSGARWGGAL